MATAVDEQDRSGRVGEPTRAKGRRNMSLADVFLRLDGRIGRQGYWLSTVTLDMLGLGIGLLTAPPSSSKGIPVRLKGTCSLSCSLSFSGPAHASWVSASTTATSPRGGA